MIGALAPERSVDIEAPDLELTLPARPENVAVARHAIGGFADVVDVPDQTLADVKLAVTEACTNVVVHAYPNGEGPMGLRASVDDGVLRVVVGGGGGPPRWPRASCARAWPTRAGASCRAPTAPASASACRSSRRSPSRSSS